MIFLLPLLMQAAGPPEVNCAQPSTQSAMNICAARDYQQADAVLNAQWQATAAVLREQDAAIDRAYDERPGHFETLLVAQRAWIDFRDAHCAGEGFAARGGSLEPLLAVSCKTALTKARTAQLLALAEQAR